MEIYAVGGAVRDALLDLPVTERDWVVVGATPTELMGLGYTQVGREFPVFLHPETHEEYALARTERKVAAGHTGFSFDTSKAVTLEQDLARRDLTINAMAQDSAGQLIDPYGGQADLANRKLRHVSAAFREDPLRVLRVARFAARFQELGFAVATETLELMAAMSSSGELDSLTPERVWQETHKALQTPRPDIYFEVLRNCGALSSVFPEVANLYGVPQPARWHPEIDTGLHTLMALKQSAALTSNPAVRFAVLTHDLGKATTPKTMLPRHHGHGERSVTLIEELAKRLRVPNRYVQLAVRVARYHGLAHRAFELRAKTIFDLITALDGIRQPERYEEFLLACEADARGRKGLEERRYVQAELLRNALASARQVTTAALSSDLEGPALGAALRRQRITAIERLLQASASVEQD